ncbi:hypothetical protein C8Q70DRAFT_1051729 [Cubamyces menziesii]|nr:hypothetical protein C8Q70DRAFT_1051729 [Cubamyces menziesii]
MFSGAFASVTSRSGLSTYWTDGGYEGQPPRPPQASKRCSRLEEEVAQLRKRLNTEIPLLPIVTSTDGGGLACEFMFPASRTSSKSSIITSSEPTIVSHSSIHIPEEDVSDAGQAVVDNGTQDRAVRWRSRDVDPENVDARVSGIGIMLDVEDPFLSGSPSEDVITATRSVSDILPASLLAEDDGLQDVQTKPGTEIKYDMRIDEYEDGGLDAVIVPIRVDLQECEVEVEHEIEEHGQADALQSIGEGVHHTEEEDVKQGLSTPRISGESFLDANGTADSEQQVMASASNGIEAVVGDEFPSSIGTLVKGYTVSPLLLVKYDAKRPIHSPVNNGEFVAVGNLARRSSQLSSVYGPASRPASLVFSQVFFFAPERLGSTSSLPAHISPLLMDWRFLTGARPLLGAPDDHRREGRRLSAYSHSLTPCNWILVSSLPAPSISFGLSTNLPGIVSSAPSDCLNHLEINSCISSRMCEVSVCWNWSLSS